MAIKGYIASSMDGYIASLDGKVEFLSNYQHIDCGYDAFIADISTIVMGRKTYEAILSFGVDWPYSNQHTWVLTSHDNLPVEDASVQLWTKGIDALIEKLKLPEAGNTWVVGGAQLQASFINKRALDTLEVFLMPEILGIGVPLFPEGLISAQTIKSVQASMIDETVIRHVYQFNTTKP